jgi:hypothetical protein
MLQGSVKGDGLVPSLNWHAPTAATAPHSYVSKTADTSLLAAAVRHLECHSAAMQTTT